MHVGQMRLEYVHFSRMSRVYEEGHVSSHGQCGAEMQLECGLHVPHVRGERQNKPGP